MTHTSRLVKVVEDDRPRSVIAALHLEVFNKYLPIVIRIPWQFWRMNYLFWRIVCATGVATWVGWKLSQLFKTFCSQARKLSPIQLQDGDRLRKTPLWFLNFLFLFGELKEVMMREE